MKIQRKGRYERMLPLFVMFVMAVAFGPFGAANAQSNEASEAWSDERRAAWWRERWEENDEGGNIDDEDVREWRRGADDETRERIDDLDDDAVEDLSIPVLFGVAVDDLYPNFGDPRDGGAREHEGLDIMAPLGMPVVTPTDAVVLRTGDGSGSGLYVRTANPGDETFIYMHLDEIADIDEGDELEEGDVIGYVGNTGNAQSGAPHLHLEIREDGDPTDPFDRLTETFSLAERIEFLEGALRDHDDEDELAEMLVREHLGAFIQARAEGIELPDAIIDALPEDLQEDGAFAPVRDLTIGDLGTDVTVLQSILISSGHLDVPSPTGYFGPMTESALASYQAENGISPASGYYGPITRAHIAGNSRGEGAVDMTREEMIEKIAELTELLRELRAELARREGN